jgi:hypothetical protein
MPEGRFQSPNGSDFEEENSNVCSGILKVFPFSTTPFGRKSLVKFVELMIHKLDFLSIQKWDCENYLLRIAICNGVLLYKNVKTTFQSSLQKKGCGLHLRMLERV